MRRIHVVAYDVTDRRRLRRALAAVRAFGLGGQKSVHECALGTRERRELEARLLEVLDFGQDRLLLLRLDPRSRPRVLAGGPTYARPPDLLVID